MNEPAREPLDPATFDRRLTHDLQAPISTARGLVGLAEEDAADAVWDEIPELLSSVRLQLDRLDALVAGLVALSAAREPARLDERIGLDGCVRDLFGRLGQTPGGRTVTLACTLGDLSYRTDPAALQRMLLTLLDNGCRFAAPDDDAPAIRVTGRCDSDWLEIDVEDDGVGFDETCDGLFEPFQRGPGAPVAPGLGLAIAVRQAQSLGGEVVLVSHRAPTCVRIRLPAPADPASA